MAEVGEVETLLQTGTVAVASDAPRTGFSSKTLESIHLALHWCVWFSRWQDVYSCFSAKAMQVESHVNKNLPGMVCSRTEEVAQTIYSSSKCQCAI